ncbi:DUF1990 family protein [Streptomyces sp. NPDC059070]|uniref:DUF1990 family protein n=1 Tax=unclassified Streptomyces TaxID=2593676 RepID=UPI0034E197BD
MALAAPHGLAEVPAFTYPEVGATARFRLPAGYHHLRHRVRIGHGPDVLRRAGAAITDWRMHRALGVGVDSPAERAAPGVPVTIRLGAGAFAAKAPCRVVWTADEPHRVGFAYGTLPGHPECGEEAFLVELDRHDGVWFTVTAFSHPASRWTRLAGPLVPVGQRLYARRCGVVLRRLVREGA